MRGSNIPKAPSPRKGSGIVVEVSNRQHRRIIHKSIQKAVRSALSLGNWTIADISVAVVDSWTMRQLNREYLQHDYATDVLSFSFLRNARQRKLVGEIVVCAEVAAKLASRQKWKWHDELLLYVVHGALHLVGYNDKSAIQQRRMRAAEQKILAELGIKALPGDLTMRSKETL